MKIELAVARNGPAVLASSSDVYVCGVDWCRHRLSLQPRQTFANRVISAFPVNIAGFERNDNAAMRESRGDCDSTALTEPGHYALASSGAYATVEILQRFGWGVREFLWPRRCAGCGIRDTWLCDDCASNPAPWEPAWCPRCGVPTALPACRCDALPAAIHSARAVGPHAGWLRNSVRLLKYADERARAVPLGRMMTESLADLPPYDVIIPVPLASRRERTRGYNQAFELAAVIAHETGMALNNAWMRRTIDTPPQVGLARSFRQQNVRGAFQLTNSDEVRGTSVLVVDDVFTTGATLGEIARLLKTNGARRVDVATVSCADAYLSPGAETIDGDM
jgi:ComF family protein